MSGGRALAAGWTVWLLLMTLSVSGSAQAGECANVFHHQTKNAIYSDCEVRSSGQHFVFRIDKNTFFFSENAASALDPFVPAAGGPIPYFAPAYYGFYASATGDACASITYPLNNVTEVTGSNGSYYCLVASETNTAGGREQRISGRWLIVPGNGTHWYDLRMTDSAIPWSLTLGSSGTGSGTIGGGGPRVVGETITLTATANTGSTFAGWSGDAVCATSFTMPDRDVSCTANFALNSHAVSISSAGTGNGTTGGGGTYAFGSTVSLTASADIGSTFAGWSGHPLCAASFSMPDEAVSCIANFSLDTYDITTTASPAAGGTVECTPNPVGHGTDSTCSATANLGYTFLDFSGDCSGPACVLSNVTAARSVTANFTLNSHAVSTGSAGTGIGSTGGDGNYDFGSTVTLIAEAAAGSTFTGWSGHPLCAASFTMPDEAVSCVATFTLNSYTITTTASPAAGGTVECTPNPVDHGGDSTCTASANLGYTFAGFTGYCTGTTCVVTSLTAPTSVGAAFTLNSHAVATGTGGTGSGITAGDGTYDFGSTVTLIAAAATGSTFTGWSGHPLCADTFTMPDEAVSCIATFTLNSHDVAISSAGSGSGTTTGDGSYDFGATVTLTANADTGSTFTGWSGHPLCGDSFTMPDEAVSCTATFALNRHDVATSSTGTGSGTTTGDGTYDFGSTVTLTASPDTGSTFIGWRGHPLCGDSFTMPDEAVSCTATFSLNSYAITTSANPAAGGTVTCSPTPVDHGSDSTCTATANLGYTFAGFSGDCNGATCVLTNVSADSSVTANFSINSHAVSISSAGSGSGTTTGDGTYDFGSTVTLTASPTAGSTFIGWSGHQLCGDSFTMPDEAVSCTATFSLNSYTITATASPATGGTVACSPNPVDHGGDSVCTATAAPGEGYVFAGFSGDCSGPNCSLVSITSPQQVTAHFDPVTEMVLITRAGSEATLSVSGPGCRIVEAQFVATPDGGPADVTFPFGLLDFTLRGCTGEAVATVTYATVLPSDASYWKEADGLFNPYPAVFSGNSVTFTLVDNGAGDSDPTLGTIRDPSGVGFAAAASIAAVPLLSPWSLVALALFMAMIAGWRIVHG